jgi:hypothetical protein
MVNFTSAGLSNIRLERFGGAWFESSDGTMPTDFPLSSHRRRASCWGELRLRARNSVEALIKCLGLDRLCGWQTNGTY